MSLHESLSQAAKKVLSKTDCPTYKISAQALFDNGYTVGEVKKAAKSSGMRLVKNDSTLSVDTKDLQASLNNFLDLLAAA